MGDTGAVTKAVMAWLVSASAVVAVVGESERRAALATNLIRAVVVALAFGRVQCAPTGDAGMTFDADGIAEDALK